MRWGWGNYWVHRHGRKGSVSAIDANLGEFDRAWGFGGNSWASCNGKIAILNLEHDLDIKLYMFLRKLWRNVQTQYTYSVAY